jgi:transmembrane sensor
MQSGDLTNIVADYTATKQLTLPDGSIIYLNKNTQISYLKSFKKRVVKLDGEAFFEVKKQNGHPFMVETKNTSIKVLGTSFNVRAPKDTMNTRVAVLSGKVEFSSKQAGKKLIIEPKQQANYNSATNEIVKSELKDNNFLAWKTGILSFNNISLKEVLSTLSENYHVEFKIKDKALLELKLTCEFKNQGIEDILSEIEILLPIKLSTDKQSIIIEAKK